MHKIQAIVSLIASAIIGIVLVYYLSKGFWTIIAKFVNDDEKGTVADMNSYFAKTFALGTFCLVVAIIFIILSANFYPYESSQQIQKQLYNGLAISVLILFVADWLYFLVILNKKCPRFGKKFSLTILIFIAFILYAILGKH